MIFTFDHATVRRVVDGDTIVCDIDLGMGIHAVTQNVRVYGVNAPELSTENGKIAKAFVEAQLPAGTAVGLLSHGWDKYGGRIDAAVHYGPSFATNLGAELLAGGYAYSIPGQTP